MDKVEVKFGEWIGSGFELYKENLGVLILASLIAMVLSVATLGILAGPMMAGVLLITLSLFDKKEPRPQVGDVFKGFDYFLQTLLFFIVWGLGIFVASVILGLVPCVGQLASVLLVFVAHAFLMFGLFLIIERQMDFWPASMASFEKIKTNFLPFLGFSVVVGIIGSIGGIACGIGVCLTAPIQACILTVAYREVFDGVIRPSATSGKPINAPKTEQETADDPISDDKL